MDATSVYTWAAIVCSVVLVGVRVFLWYLRRNDDYWKKQGIPYIPRMGIITIFQKMGSKPLHEFITKYYQKYGRLHGTFEFTKPSLVVADPKLLKAILVKDFHVFSFRKDISFGDELVDNMVSVLKGEDWKRVRSIITPAFTSKRMRQMSHIINQASKAVVENFGTFAKRQEPADCKKIFGAFTLDVIANAAFATKLDSLNDPESIFVKHVKQAFEEVSTFFIMVMIFLPRWIPVKLRLGSFKSFDFFRDVILEVIKQRKQTGQRFDDVLQLLMDSLDEQNTENEPLKVDDEADQYGSISSKAISTDLKYTKLSQEELIAQCVLFFAVGYETTGSTLSFMAYCLALNQDCQEKLIEEIDGVFRKHDSINYDVIREMKYLDCFLSETLRMFPALPRLDRTATEDYKLGETGILIKKGMVVGIPVYAMHYDPEFFPEPEKFDPSRFMSSDKPDNFQYTYMPFGAGPRNCLGMRFALMEIKMCITHVLRRYRFRLDKSTLVPPKYKLTQGLLSVNELPLIVEERT